MAVRSKSNSLKPKSELSLTGKHVISVRSDVERQLVVGVLKAVGAEAHSLDRLSADDALDVGFQAARSALASLRWSQVIGERLSTTEVTDLLQVSRQALAKRVQSGSLFALPGLRTTWYPAWQFDRARRDVRHCVRDIVAEFRNALDKDVDPFTVATWMNTPNDELDGITPAAWIVNRTTPAPVIDSAREFAARLAQ